ncbi:ABC transporter permease [Nocardioides bruguierae]|uniref:ABC transporter permease n=1 Tax=Nocardioides bruguierae TaxID=2945102 RepID=A0A9X2IFJ7_9ACTN|nr:ABC transporter permease [Nocardioides bruguierae]MCM0621143.1 ABC transporter permease [Nocardioides bruguierae]
MKAYLSRNRWWINRTLVLPLHLLIFSIAAFAMVRLVPGDPVLARIDTSNGFSQEDYDRMAEAMGLNGSIWSQGWDFVVNLFQGDLGTSTSTSRPVWTEIMDRLPATLELIFLGLGGSVLVSLVLAFVWLQTDNRVVRRVLDGYRNLTGALPDFAVAILSIVVFFVLIPIAPAPIGRLTPGTSEPLVTGLPLLDTVLVGRFDLTAQMAAHYVLPVAVLVFIHASGIWRQLSLGIEEQVSEPPTLFKIASGATRRSVFRSILRRSAASSIVTLGNKFGALLGGVIVIEQLFGFGGVGQFALDSVRTLDFPGLQGFLIVIAGLCLVGFFLVDIANMLLDPRRRPGVRVDA